MSEIQTEHPEKAETKEESVSRQEIPAKICCYFNPAGNAPIMKTRKWAVEKEKQISWISKFIHQYLKLAPEERIFLYVNQTFAPSPDQNLKNLYECYGVNGKLNLYYCTNQAWG